MATPTAAVALVVAAACFLSATAQPPPYTNYTVGDAAGWVFHPATGKAAADYAAWASKKSFYLGDYLLFNTNANSTVIQTYNKTTYGLCSLDEDYGNLTSQYSAPDGADGGPGSGGADAVAVALTMEGDNYFFSSAGEGVQCRSGMRFQIAVGHGRGLPQELNQPPPPPPPVPAGPPPIEATPSSQNEVFYNGGRGAEGRLAVGFSVGVMGLLVAAAVMPGPNALACCF